VLNRVLATGAEPIQHVDFRQDEFAARVEPPARPGDIGGAMSVRRFLLDPILAEAAGEAGAGVMMETNVTHLVQNGRVTGVRVRSGGSERELSARLVVGADGRNSTVAKLTGARKYHVVPSERFLYWGFFEGTGADPEPELAFHHWHGRVVVACPADSGLYQVIVIPDNRLMPQCRGGLERACMDQARACAPVADKLTRARRVGKLLGILRWESFFRESAATPSESCPVAPPSSSRRPWPRRPAASRVSSGRVGGPPSCPGSRPCKLRDGPAKGPLTRARAASLGL
jgi:2-polyprenyl-6-methoxyphenol hydroxylase-like FAD-dependent oxidoreductase